MKVPFLTCTRARIARAVAALTAAASLVVAAPVAAQLPVVMSPTSLARADTLPLTLDAAIARAVRDGDETRLAAAQLDAAEAQITGARAAGLPQLRVSSTYSHQLENARAQAVGSIFGQSNTYNSGASLSQPLFQGGRVVAAARAANRVGEAARLEADEVERTVVLDVARAYLNARLAARLVDIQQGNLALAAERLAQVEQLEAGGRAARYDVLRARVERANLEPLVIQARNDLELAELELKRLLNLPLDQPLRLTTALGDDAVGAAVTAVLLADATEAAATGTTVVRGAALPAAIESRPSVRSAKLMAEARRYGVQVARADLLPTVTVSATFGYLAFPTGGFLQNVPTRFGKIDPITCPAGSAEGRICTEQNGGWFSDRSLFISVAWPLFDGLRTRANIQNAQAQAHIAELQLAQRREAVALEIARARSQLTRARAVFAAQQQTVAEAEETYRLAALRFSRGLATQLETSDAQLLRLTAQTNAARASVDLYLAAAELARAEGYPIPTLGDAADAPSSIVPPSDVTADAPPSIR